MRGRCPGDDELDGVDHRLALLHPHPGRHADVLERPAGDRFAPAAQGEPAYDKGDVDALCDQLVAYFTDGHPMSVDDVRRAAFGRRRGPEGYREAVVDVYLDHVADVMASVP